MGQLTRKRGEIMSCKYCQWSGGNHHTACPSVLLTSRGRWDAGWNDGRDGKDKTSDDPTYLLGYNVGEIAKEEAENGHDPHLD